MSYLTGVRRQVKAWDGKAPKQPPAARPDFAARDVARNYGGTEAPGIADGYEGYAAAYRSYVWVRKAIDEKAKNISGQPVRVVDANGKALDNHVVSQLLRRGNDQMPMSQVWAQWLTSMDLGGEGPLEIVDDLAGNPLWLWPRRPDLVLVKTDTNPERANYPSVAGYIVMPEQVGGKPIDVPPENMIFTRYHNPLSVWRGLAPITAVRASIIIDVYAQAWSKTFYQKGARPDFGIIAPQGITQTEKERIKAEIMHQHSGNWFEPIVLEEGVTDIKPFSFPPSDMEWVEQRELSRNEIGAIFGVPDEVMGFGRNTYENFGKAVEAFWTLTLRPLCQMRDEMLTHFFTVRRPLLAPGERVETDLSSIGVLQEDLLPKVEAASKLWVMGAPFNQLDEQFQLGVGPIPNGEFPNGQDPAVAQQMAELAAMAVQGNGPQDGQDDGGNTDADATQNRALRLAMKIAGELQDYDQQLAEQEAQQGGKAARPFRLNGTAIPEYYKALQLIHDPGDDDTPEEQLLQALEQTAQREIARELRKVYRDLLPPNAENMELYELQAYIEQRIGSQALNDALDAAVRRGTDAGVSIAVEQLSSLGVGFDYTMVHTTARDWARSYAAELITKVNSTTKQAVRESVARWYDNGEHLDALTKDLAPTFGKQRARLIAMTETTHSAAQGTLRGYRDSGVVTAMVWLTANDEKVCPFCGSLDGKTVGLEGRFSDALPPELQRKLGARAFQTPPAHPGCRCRIGAQVIEIGGGNG